MPTMARQEIFGKVQQALVDVLAVDQNEVTEDATLFNDLGMESIDFLELIFRLEKAFSIKIAQEELTQNEVVTNPVYHDNRKLNAAGIAALKERIKAGAWTAFEQDPSIDKIQNVFTVGTIIHFVEQKLAAA
ncbi:MAG: acyl carrier protein [Planctomycetota bacterium]